MIESLDCGPNDMQRDFPINVRLFGVFLRHVSLNKKETANLHRQIYTHTPTLKHHTKQNK